MFATLGFCSVMFGFVGALPVCVFLWSILVVRKSCYGA